MAAFWPTTSTSAGPGSALASPRLAIDQAARAAVLSLAGAAVRAAVRGVPEPPPWPDALAALRNPAGAFVCLRAGGTLRGCIGTLEARHPLPTLVARVAAAACRDPRFGPVTADELTHLWLEVSVVCALRRVLPDALDPARDGAVLRLRGRRAVLLPHVARRRGWDRATLLARLARKAGLPAAACRAPDAELSAFDAITVAGPLTGDGGRAP